MSLDKIISKTAYLAKLGGYIFDMDSASVLKSSRKTSYAWAKQKHIGSLRQLHFLGPEDDSIQLSGTFYPHHRGGLEQMNKLRVEAGQGKPLRLVYTDSKIGQNLGHWVIKQISEDRTLFLANGIPLKISFNINLWRYDGQIPA